MLLAFLLIVVLLPLAGSMLVIAALTMAERSEARRKSQAPLQWWS